MKDLIAKLRAIIDNPDDLSTLPETINALEEYHTGVQTRETDDQERIIKLQDSNRNLISQIPISTGEPAATAPEDKEVTFEDAQEELLKTMNGGNY